MPKNLTRIPLDVKPEFALEIDRAVAKLTILMNERQSRAGFVLRAIQNEIERVNALAAKSAEVPR